MSSLLARIARALSHRWKRSLGFALATLLVLGALAGTADPPADSFDVPGADSQEAYDLFRDHSPAFSGGDATVVYTVATTTTRNPALVLAAAVMGSLFGLQRRASGGIQAPTITHLTWSALMLRYLPPLFRRSPATPDNPNPSTR